MSCLLGLQTLVTALAQHTRHSPGSRLPLPGGGARTGSHFSVISCPPCFPGGLVGKEAACLPLQEAQVRSLGREDPLEKGMATKNTPLFLPREFHGQRSLVGCSPWGCKELDMTEGLALSLSCPPGAGQVCDSGMAGRELTLLLL